jgi:hypothetical protein
MAAVTPLDEHRAYLFLEELNGRRLGRQWRSEKARQNTRNAEHKPSSH